MVGAGPTGLLLAAELERRGVACLLIDALEAPQTWDRATVVHERTLEIFEALGIAEPLIADGVKTRGARFYSDGELVGELLLDATESRYGYQLGVSEEVTEAVLTDHLGAQGGAVTRSTRLVGTATADDGVVAIVERGGEREEIRARWLVGCDGYHSTVREAAGIDYPGAPIEAAWAVFDAAAEGWDGAHDLVHAHLDQPPLILTPLPGRRWRVYMRPAADDSDLVAEATAELRRYAPDARFVGIESPARFRCHSRVAPRYRSGRVLLAGDAAHACSPNEGHGMNTGLQDAFNLGWKLAMVCRGEAGEGLLDSYESERRPVAELVVGSGADVEAAHALTDPAERAERDAGIRIAMADPEIVHHEAAAASEIDRAYPPSRAVAGDRGSDPPPGVLLPDTPPVQPAGGDPAPLHELTHRPGHTLLVLGGQEADPARVGELVAELEARPHPAVDAVVGLSASQGGGERVGTIDEGLAARLGVAGITVLAVRPDRYIGLRDDSGDARAVADYLEALVA